MSYSESSSFNLPSEFQSQLQFDLLDQAGVGGGPDKIALLTQAWINERNAPDLLAYRRFLVEPLIESLEKQSERVAEDIESGSDNKLHIMIYQTEMERVKYLLRNYLRTRLYKIEKYTLYLLRRHDLNTLLSPQEIVYARRYQELVESHNFDSFLHQLPRSQHKQDEKHGDVNMVVTPNMDAPVFCQVLDNIGHIVLQSRENDDSILFEKNDIYILRYRDIEQYLDEGRVKLV
ncbi:GINS complex, Sld5 component [Backusella circina FSU 941]|nr:GINS complex, Sld5 component [Backusella circina FSU 941]